MIQTMKHHFPGGMKSLNTLKGSTIRWLAKLEKKV